MIDRACRTEVVQFLVEDLEVLLGIGPHLGVREMRPTLVAQRAQRHVLQAVAGRTDLGIDLQPPLKLVLIEAAERPLEGKVHVLGVAFFTGGERAAGRKGQGRDCADRECLHHLPDPFSYSAGLATVAVPPLAALCASKSASMVSGCGNGFSITPNSGRITRK